MGNKTKKINMSDKIKYQIWKDIDTKRDILAGMGSKLRMMTDKQSEEYSKLKNKCDELEADIEEMISHLDGSYDAQKLTQDAKNAKEERDKAISMEITKSKELEDKLAMLEFKREEEIQKIKNLREKINGINLLSEDGEYDEVLKKAEEWKMQNEMVKRSLSLKTVNSKIAMTKIRKSNQDAKNIENIRKIIDTYNEKITEYKRQMDELNNKRPKSIPEEFMREHDWILGAVTMDKNKKVQEVIDKIDEGNRERREFEQEKYFIKSHQGKSDLPYKELNDEERNELITYSEEMTTFKQLREFLKIKAARAAGKVVGLTILAVRKIKSIFKPKEENKASEPTEETQSATESTFVDEARNAIQERTSEINLQEPAEELFVKEPTVEAAVEEPVKESVKAPVKVNPFELRIAVSKDVKKAVEEVSLMKKEVPKKTETEIEIDETTFE